MRISKIKKSEKFGRNYIRAQDRRKSKMPATPPVLSADKQILLDDRLGFPGDEEKPLYLTP